MSDEPVEGAGRGFRDGIVRLGVRFHDHPTSISLDHLLFTYIKRELGNDHKVKAWAQRTVARIEALEEQAVFVAPRDVDASLSRLVQREALRMLMDG